MEEIRLKAKRQEVPVILESSDGTEIQYILREMTGEGRDDYLADINKRMKQDRNGSLRLDSFRDLQASLIVRCLFTKDTDKMVPIDEIRNMPATSQKILFEKAQKMNGLEADIQDVIKNA